MATFKRSLTYAPNAAENGCGNGFSLVSAIRMAAPSGATGHSPTDNFAYSNSQQFRSRNRDISDILQVALHVLDGGNNDGEGREGARFLLENARPSFPRQ